MTLLLKYPKSYSCCVALIKGSELKHTFNYSSTIIIIFIEVLS